MPLASRATQARAARVAATREDATPVAPRRGREEAPHVAPDPVDEAVTALGNAVSGADEEMDTADLPPAQREQVAEEEEDTSSETNPGPADKAGETESPPEEQPTRRRRADAGVPRGPRPTRAAPSAKKSGPAPDLTDKREVRAAVTELEAQYRELVRAQDEERAALKSRVLELHARLLDL